MHTISWIVKGHMYPYFRNKNYIKVTQQIAGGSNNISLQPGAPSLPIKKRNYFASSLHLLVIM